MSETQRISLPDDLQAAARSLEARFELLRVPSRKISMEEWGSLPDTIRRAIPQWFTVLLSNYRLAEGVLEYRDPIHPYMRQFSFFKPDEYKADMTDDSLYARLPAFGFVPLAYESDGSVWLTRIKEGPSGAIHMLDHSDWNGNEPSLRNGLVFASSRLSLLLASMGVSEGSYYETPGGITSLIWHREKLAQ